MLFKLSNLNSNFVLTLGYLNPALNNSALNWMKLSTRRLKQLCCFMHNFINDSERNSMITRGSDYHSHNTRYLIMLLEFHYLDIIKLSKFA